MFIHVLQIKINELVKLTMRRSIILILFCAIGVRRCEHTVNDEVESVHEIGASGAHSGKMINYDEFMAELDGYPDYNNNNNYDWGE